MSGVIDKNGVQWERCNKCTEFVQMDNLGYIKPSPQHPHGMDICVKCVDAGLRAAEFKFGQVVPAEKWKRKLVNR